MQKAPPLPHPIEADQQVDISVLICTRNRASQLQRVLDSATRLRIPEGLRWELLIIDNGSSDNTADIVSGFATRLPTRLVREETAGLSNARNRGVIEARGRYICWTDDDVVIDEGWLSAYAAAFERHPQAAIFGGRITPVLEEPTPRWFGRLANEWPLTISVAKRDYGNLPIPLDFDAGVLPWGANFAVRTAEQHRVLYDPGLGVSPLQQRVGEEAEVIFQLLNQGESGWWVPDAQVMHMIPPARQSLSFVFRFSASNGETVCYLESLKAGRHHKSTNLREIDRSRGGPGRLRLMAALNFVIFGVTWLCGAKRRSLTFLVRAGFSAGAARFHAAERRRRPSSAADASKDSTKVSSELA